MFIVERRADSIVTTIAVYATKVLPSDFNDLWSIAYDDVEQRLYIATYDWTASLSVPVSSIHETRERTESATSLPVGLYDLFGRYVAQDEHLITSSGLYLRVDGDRVQRVLVVR